MVKHNSDIAGWTSDSEAAAAVREVERADYGAMHTNLTESVHMAPRWHQGTIAPRALKKNTKQIWRKCPKADLNFEVV